MVEEQAQATFVYELTVGMTCEGCSGAVNRILGRSDQIDNVTCDIEGQKVTVEGREGLDLVEMLKAWSESA